MTVAKQLDGQFTPQEIDFFAKDDIVTVIPNFSLPIASSTCDFIAGQFGPFQPNRECEVPLWLALTLWKRRKCSIKPPDWMAVGYLQTVLELERQDPSSFQPLPFHYQEVAHCLFTGGTQESLPREVFGDDQGRVRDLVNLVQKTRYNKILQGLGMMQEAAAVKLNNLSHMELNAVRAFFTGALDQFHRYSNIRDPDVGTQPAVAASPAAAAVQVAPDAQQPVRQLRRGG